MPQQIALKNAASESRVFRNRVFVAVGFIVFFTCIFLLQLLVLQVIQHDHYVTRAQDNRVKVVPIAPTRGLIFSRDGVLLAENRPTYSLEVIPERVGNLESMLKQITALVALEEKDVQRFRRELGKRRRFENVPLRLNLSDEEVARFSVNQHRFPGFSVRAQLARYYPTGAASMHVVGYVGRIDEDEFLYIDGSNYSATSHIGKTGVEKAFESILHGQVGYQQVEVNAEGRISRVLQHKAAIAGKDIYLTLDSTLQSAAVNALGENRGAVVAIDPNTGGVLALVSTPGYNPNLFVNGIRADVYKRLRDSPDRPLFNRALQGQYPPGSTIKPLLALHALDKGLRDIETTISCPGWYQLPGIDYRYRDWKKVGHGEMNLTRAIAESCDVYFYHLAKDMGIDTIHEVFAAFGLGQRTGVDIPGETAGLVPSSQWKLRVKRERWYLGETLIAGIGQGFTLTSPLQLAAATAILARRGKYVRPRVVGQIEDPITFEAVETEWQESDRVAEVSTEHWNHVIAAMGDVVHGATGTARATGASAHYKFAGKTGTAQLFSLSQDENVVRQQQQNVAERLRDHALFIAFAPIDEPLIALAIVVENGGSGSKTAAPIARRLFDIYLSQYVQPAAVPDHG